MKQPGRAPSVPRADDLLARLPRRLRDLLAAARTAAERRRVGVYLVGGPVRDLVRTAPSADLDLTVVGDAVGYAEALGASLGARVTRHPRFGTATLALPDGRRLDVATARRERYPHPAALPEVHPATIEEDLFRRDFTVNALAIRLDARGGAVLDPFGGIHDLRAGVLRALHGESYRDDPTRILRGARYAARLRLRFSRADRHLIERALADGVLQRLSLDRLFRELTLLCSEAAPEAALKVLDDLTVLRTLDPALRLGPRAVADMRRARRGLARYARLGIPAPEPWRVYLLLLLNAVPARVRPRAGGCLGVKGPLLKTFLGALRALLRLQQELCKARMRNWRLRRQLDRISPDLRFVLWVLSGARGRRRIERYHTRLAHVRPALTGRDLENLGFPPGPSYRRIMALLLEGRVEGRLRTRKDEIAFLRARFGGVRPAGRRARRGRGAN